MNILAKAVGRRKEAVAQVQLKQGTGQFIINNKPAHEYLQNDFYSLLCVKAPFENILLTTKPSAEGLSTLPQLQNDLKHEGSFTSEKAENPDLTTDSLFSNTHSTEETLNNATNIKKNEATQDAFLNLDTIVIVKGGGLRGQTEAIRLGISRALCSLSTNTPEQQLAEVLNFSNISEIKKQLKDKGYLTQDSRVKERRKYGLKKARKASQYHKR